jgi:predicted small secreted protein
MNGRMSRAPLVLALIAVVVAACATIVAFGQHTSNQHIVNRAQGNLKSKAVQAAVQAQVTPVPACNPAPGAAKLGVCAPTQALGAANSLAIKAGDPLHISGKQPLGVDTSSYQPCGYSLHGLDFAFYKATEGTGYTDRCLRSNVARAKAEHKPYGVYDFLRPGRSSATAEANHFISAVSGARANTSLPPVADVEANAGLNQSQLHNYVCTWHNVVRHALHRTVSITYTGAWFWSPQVGNRTHCGSILWISAYAAFYITPFSWKGHGGATIWQYSDGIYGPTPHSHGWDSDVFLGTHGALARLANAKHDKPIASKFARYCSELDGIHYWKAKHGHVSARQHRRAVSLRKALKRGNIGCTARPHSKPYRGAHRKGALA